MRKVIEYALMSVDGVVENPDQYLAYRDDAYLRDGLGVLMACDALLLGRRTYQSFARAWPGRDHPWAGRMNTIRKYVFSSKLENPEWDNTTVIRGEIAAEVARLKQQEGRNLLVIGHARIAQTLLSNGLIDLLDLSVHPLIVGTGELFFRECERTSMRLVATKTFSRIVKLTYEIQHQAG